MWASIWLLVPSAALYIFRNEMYIKYADKVSGEVAATLANKRTSKSAVEATQPVEEKDFAV